MVWDAARSPSRPRTRPAPSPPRNCEAQGRGQGQDITSGGRAWLAAWEQGVAGEQGGLIGGDSY